MNKQHRKELFKFSSAIRLQFNPNHMLRDAVIFFVIAIVAAIFGFGGIAVGAVSIAKLVFFVFVILAVMTLLFEASIFKKR